MPLPIERDLKRFDQIVRGRARQDYQKYIKGGSMIGALGGKGGKKELVSIPVRNIETPHFIHGQKGSSGTGQGDGDIGQPIGKGQDKGDGAGPAGSEEGKHLREVEVPREDLARWIKEDLKLPDLNKGKGKVRSVTKRYDSISVVGPNSLRHLKRTYKEALKRSIASGIYDPNNPIVVPEREDTRYKASKEKEKHENNAAVIFMMDVSGSMTDEQKEIARIMADIILLLVDDDWPGTEKRFVVHDAVAHEVDEDKFFHTKESGGTRISTAYKVAEEIVERDFPLDEWDILAFQFTDGDNWGEDNEVAKDALINGGNGLLQYLHTFGYGQIKSPYGSGDLIKLMRAIAKTHPNLRVSHVTSKDQIFIPGIKNFFVGAENATVGAGI